MQIERLEHASCALGDYIYVFCGCNSKHEPINSIERLKVGQSTDSDYIWELINMQDSIISPRNLPLVSSLNQTKICILGGKNAEE